VIDIKDFQPPPKLHGFAFAFDAQSLAAGFRKLADQIEAGGMCVQSVTINKALTSDDFAGSALTLKFIEKVDP